MLRYILLAGAAAIAIPSAGLAQVQWAQPLPGENNASLVMNQGGPVDSPGDYDIPYNATENTGIATQTFGTGQLEQARTRADIVPEANYLPDASDDTTAAQSPQPGAGVYGSQPAGGYYFGTQGDQPLVSPVSQQETYSAPAEGAYSGQSYQGYGGGYYTAEQGAPSAYEGQGQGSYQTVQTGEGLGGEGAYQQGQSTYGYGNTPANPGYGGYYMQAPPSQPYGANAPSDQGYGGSYYTGPQGAYGAPPPPASQGYGGGYYTGPQGAYGAPPPPASQGYGGGGYYTGPQGAYAAPPPSQGYGGGYYTAPQGAYAAPPPSQGYGGGYYTAPQGAYAAPPPSQGYGGGYYTAPQGAYAAPPPSQAGQTYDEQAAAAASRRQVVVLPAHIASARRYVRRTTVASLYEIRAAQIALRRSQSQDVRDFANQMIDQHRQQLAIITQAAAQAGVPQRPMLDHAHRAMLRRLWRVPASDFDSQYMHQQLVAHMNSAAVQEGYLRHGDNPILQQAAAQIRPMVQQHLEMAWEGAGVPERLAQQRSTEYAMLDQSAGRAQTYRGYTVIGPTPGEEPSYGYGYGPYRGYRGYYRGYRGYHRYYRGYRGYYSGQYPGQHQGRYYRGSFNGAAAKSAYLVPVVYQPGGAGAVGSNQGVPGTSGTTGYGSGVLGSPSYGTGGGAAPGTTSGYGAGTAIPGAGQTGGASYTSSGLGTTTPGSLSYTTPSTPGYANPGLGTTPQSGLGTTGYATTTPGAAPGLGTTPGLGGSTLGTPGANAGIPGSTTRGVGTTTPGATGPAA